MNRFAAYLAVGLLFSSYVAFFFVARVVATGADDGVVMTAIAVIGALVMVVAAIIISEVD